VLDLDHERLIGAGSVFQLLAERADGLELAGRRLEVELVLRHRFRQPYEIATEHLPPLPDR